MNKKQINTSHFRHLYPFQSRFMDCRGLQYHYIDEGQGEPVVMIHGNPTWSFYFRELIKGLTPEFRAIAVDHIGCGLSGKPDSKSYDYRLKSRVEDLEALLDHLDIQENISLVLHDWGGMIGMAYAVKHQDRIKRIIIMNTAAFLPPDGKKLPFRLQLARNFEIFSTLAVQGLNLFAFCALFMASHKGLSKEVKSGLIAPYNCWQNRIAILKFVQDIPVTENDPSYSLVHYVDQNLHTIANIPLLICWGKHDFVFDDAYLAEWQRRFPNAQVHIFSDAGHYVLEDVPDKIVKLAADFLKK